VHRALCQLRFEAAFDCWVLTATPKGKSAEILDAPGGVSAEESTIAGQLAAISAEVAESRAADGYEGTAARLRVAAAVFGA
jgi:hypothetical protein